MAKRSTSGAIGIPLMRAPGWAELYEWRVERGSGMPLFRQVYRQIRSAILSQALRPGTKLPSTRVLASRLGLARASVVSAYEQLLAEGFLSGRIGSGTYIASNLPEALDGRAPARTLRVSARPAVSNRASALGGVTVPTGPSDPRPFTTGRFRVDARTLAAWRRLTYRAIRSLGPTDLGYSDARGLPELRQEICEYLRAARAVRCEPEHIIVTSGTQQATDLAIRVLLDRSDETWVEDPGYPMTHDALVAAGIKVRPIPVDGDGLEVRAGLRAAPKARAVFITPSHQFPLGVVLSMSRRLELLAWARETGAWIIEDDFDNEFRYAGRPLASLQGLDDGERTIYVGTLNKVLFPGLRLGYMVVPRAGLRAFVNARHLIDRHPPSLQQTVLTTFMREGHFAAHIRRMRLVYRDQRDLLVTELARRAGDHVRLHVPDQGMHLVAYLRDGRSDLELEHAADERGVVVRAIRRMYRKVPPQSGLMLGFTGYPREAIVPAAARLAEALADGARDVSAAGVQGGRSRRGARTR